MSDGYARDRDKITDNNVRGRIFENGTNEYYRDRQNGYTPQSDKYKVPGVGATTFDKHKDDRGRIFTIEEKSGRLEGPKDESNSKSFAHCWNRGRYTNTYYAPSRVSSSPSRSATSSTSWHATTRPVSPIT